MLFLNKSPDRDFTVLNLTDPQMSTAEWADGHPVRQIMTYTLSTLLERVKPDLITVSGDISWGKGNDEAYTCFAKLLHSYGIPWAVVWGNHDNDCNPPYIRRIAEQYAAYSTCLYEAGEEALGNGNYVIAIRSGERVVEGLILMDTHDSGDFTLLDRYCVPKTYSSYASLTPAQIDWYRGQVAALTEMGCGDSTLIVHIPIYGFRQAFYAATEETLRAPKAVSLADSYRGIGWKPEYAPHCFGVNREGIASSEYDDGVLDALVECHHTRHVIAGHEHVNNFSIPYRSVRMTYATKLGSGCYWDPDLNGGTVLVIGEEGVKELRHEYVDVTHLIS